MIFLDQSVLESSSLSQQSDCLRTPNEEFRGLFVKYKTHHWSKHRVAFIESIGSSILKSFYRRYLSSYRFND